MDPEQYSVFQDPIEKGFSAAGDKSLMDFQISPFVTMVMGDDVKKCMMPIRGLDGPVYWRNGCAR